MVGFAAGRLLNDRGALIARSHGSMRPMASEVAALWWEGTERAREKLAELRPHSGQAALLNPDQQWEVRLHGLLGAPWPCDEQEAFTGRWSETLELLQQRGLDIGRGAYGGWDDADQGFARVAWCLTRHLRPREVVETGVARGLTTRLLLQALKDNGSGR